VELRHLRYFVAVAEAGSFTGASERLWVAQPGLSTQIRRLETELGVRLFDRHTRGVELTEAGSLLLERARAVLVAADMAGATGADVRAGLNATIRVGVSSGPAWGGLTALLERYRSERPSVEVTTIRGPGSALWRDLREGRLDGLLAPDVFGSPDLRSLALGEEPWVLLAGPGHPLAGDGPLPWHALDGEKIAVSGHRDDGPYERALAAALDERGADVELVACGPVLDASVARGDALALTTAPPACAACAGAAAAPAVHATCTSVRRLEPPVALTFALLSREEDASPAFEAFIAAAREHTDEATRRPRLRVAA